VLSQWKRDVPKSYFAPGKIEQKYRALHPMSIFLLAVALLMNRARNSWNIPYNFSRASGFNSM